MPRRGGLVRLGPTFCSMSASMPPKACESNDVPPASVKLPPVDCRKPTTQEPCTQNNMPSCTDAASSARSGTSREESAGTVVVMPAAPVSICQAGLEKNALTPPPPDPKAEPVESSFHAASGMYPLAETSAEGTAEPAV